MTVEPPLYVEIVEFWRQAGPERWFAHDEAFDAEIRGRFETMHLAAARGELADWIEQPEGALGLLLLLDQFPRNLWRDSAHAYATDALARSIAVQALANDFHRAVEPELRPFFFLPFEHSENPEDQALAVSLFDDHAVETGDQSSLQWALLHQDIIRRFGRFPHRNTVVGRVTTEAEAAFLADGGFKG